MEKIHFLNEVWRPIEACPYKEGSKYIVLTENGGLVTAIVYDHNLYSARKHDFHIITNAHMYIPYPYEDVKESYDKARNDIPTEFVLPYIRKERDKAQADLEKERLEHKLKIDEYKQKIAEYEKLINPLKEKCERLQQKQERYDSCLASARKQGIREGAKSLVKIVNFLMNGGGVKQLGEVIEKHGDIFDEDVEEGTEEEVIAKKPRNDNDPIIKEEILGLDNGTRIWHILKDRDWMFGESRCVETIGEMKQITEQEYLRHYSAGKKSWGPLSEYIETL